MTNLFHIPGYKINTGKFSNLLHDAVVKKFEENFCRYVGARYGCSFHSATAAIFLLYSEYSSMDIGNVVKIPSIMPHVVAQAILNARHVDRNFHLLFHDDVNWVGGSYTMYETDELKVVDSAHRVDRLQYAIECKDSDLMIFSFYPTKPVGSCDGGMIVSNNPDRIETLRLLSMNGTSFAASSTDREISRPDGYKMYMNSLSAYMANENLKRLDQKKKKLAWVREIYNAELGYSNTSDHLYRVKVQDNKAFLKKAKDAGIACGIHYPALHLNSLFCMEQQELPLSEKEAAFTLSIPFHERLTRSEIKKVISFIKTTTYNW